MRRTWILGTMGLAVAAIILAWQGSANAGFTASAPARQETSPNPSTAELPSLGRIAFIQDGDIWVKDELDGEPLRLTNDGQNSEPRWSPSGKWVAFRKTGAEVWVVSEDGVTGSRLNQSG